MIRAGTTSWSDTVRQDPFRSILLSTVAVVLVLLTPESDGLPTWLHREVGLTLVLFAVAFQRVRQAAALEGATVDAWDSLMRTSGRRRVDEALDGPYLLATFLLPLSAVSVVLFLPVLLLAETTAMLHQTLLLRAQRSDLDAAAVPRRLQDRSALRRIFRWRRRQVAVRIGLVIAASVRILMLISVDGADRIGRDPVVLGAVLLIAVSVYVVDPLRSPLHDFIAPPSLLVTEVDATAGSDDELVRRLDAILEASVETGGIDAARMIARLSDGTGHRMLVAAEDGIALGLLTLQRTDAYAAIWWLCVDPSARHRGVASALIARAMHLLDDADVILIESDLEVADAGLRAARAAAIRRFGSASRLTGVRWSSTPVGGGYDLFAVEPGGPIDDARLRGALRGVATFSLGRHPEDLSTALGTIEAASLRRAPI